MPTLWRAALTRPMRQTSKIVLAGLQLSACMGARPQQQPAPPTLI